MHHFSTVLNFFRWGHRKYQLNARRRKRTADGQKREEEEEEAKSKCVAIFVEEEEEVSEKMVTPTSFSAIPIHVAVVSRLCQVQQQEFGTNVQVPMQRQGTRKAPRNKYLLNNAKLMWREVLRSTSSSS